MTLNKDQIRFRASAFASNWATAFSEQSDRQSFWDAFYGVFDLSRRHVAVYEQAARRASTGRHGWIDMLHPGEMAVEHKSRGEDLDAAMNQLEDYLVSLREVDRPWLLVACDFARFKWKNLETDEAGEFALADFVDNLDLFWWLGGGDTPMEAGLPEVDVNLYATQLLADLHDELKLAGYPAHDMREWLTRILFCLFADDTEVWERKIFETFIEANTKDDGSDLGSQINHVFQILDTPKAERSPNLTAEQMAFEYVNGDLFENRLAIPSCNEAIRDALRRACRYNWGKVSPAIFGSLFQNVMEPAERRQLGAHYTTEENILRTIRPLFLDELEAELDRSTTRPSLDRLHDKVAGLTFFDPACGCGNFLVIAYREMRRLELQILRKRAEVGRTRQRQEALQLEASLDFLCRVTVDQFYGIEIEEFPALIARTALYLTDHLANRQVSAEFGQHFVRFPIPASPHVAIGNALRMAWDEVLPRSEADYVFGNPPFVGMAWLDSEQDADNALVFSQVRAEGLRSGRLDYVAGWYAKALEYAEGAAPRFAFVSTNSITQGEQARSLGPLLDRYNHEIDFAHRTFQWTSEAKGKATVQVVIIGFSAVNTQASKRLFEYPDPRGEPIELTPSSINWYLTAGPKIYPRKHRTPLVDGVPSATKGSQPTDGGNLIVKASEYSDVASDAVAAKYLRRLIGAKEMLDGTERWCLWLVDADPIDVRSSLTIRRRLELVAAMRAKSPTASVREQAATPGVFTQIRQPESAYLCIPRHSSENRSVVPMQMMDAEDIAHDSTLAIDGCPRWLFGILQSSMFMAWVGTICGRLESRFRIDPDLGIHAFPLVPPQGADVAAIERAIDEVVSVRARFSGASLGDLYDVLAMPADLAKAHRDLDRAVDRSFGFRRKTPTDADRLAFLLERYEQLSAPLIATPKKKRRRHS